MTIDERVEKLELILPEAFARRQVPLIFSPGSAFAAIGVTSPDICHCRGIIVHTAASVELAATSTFRAMN
jgi:hypothetical protein